MGSQHISSAVNKQKGTNNDRKFGFSFLRSSDKVDSRDYMVPAKFTMDLCDSVISLQRYTHRNAQTSGSE